MAGSYVEESPRSLMNTNPDFFRHFNLVIATQVRPRQHAKVPIPQMVCPQYRRCCCNRQEVTPKAAFLGLPCRHIWTQQLRLSSFPPACPPLQLSEADAVTIDAICRQHSVRLLLLRSYGLMGYVRPSVPEQRIVESKPDSKVDDLR